MTTKKFILVIAGIVATLFLVGVLFVAGIIGVAFYSLSHSEAAETAKTFLRRNEKLKSDIGEVKDFGVFVMGSVNTKNADGEASLSLKTIGERQTVNSTVSLTYRNSGKWQVTDASYVDEAGKTVELLNKYESEPPEQDDAQK
ncbi:MAG: hypothetical protein NVSMB56_09830 [Pyrinomonadaceae bacterium]